MHSSTFKHNFISLLETYLDFTTPDSLLKIEGYDLVCADQNKKSLPIRISSFPYANQALFLEMTYNNKKVMVSVIYRSPSQNNNRFEKFHLYLELQGTLTQDHPHDGHITSIQQRE